MPDGEVKRDELATPFTSVSIFTEAVELLALSFVRIMTDAFASPVRTVPPFAIFPPVFAWMFTHVPEFPDGTEEKSVSNISQIFMANTSLAGTSSVTHIVNEMIVPLISFIRRESLCEGGTERCRPPQAI